MKKLLYLIAVVFITASYSTGRYVSNSQNLNLTQTQVVLSEANFRVVKTVSTYVTFKEKFNFSSKQLQQSAYAALLREANLQGSQVLINVTMEQVQRVARNLFGFTTYKDAVRVTGVVVEFLDKNGQPISNNTTASLEEKVAEEETDPKFEAYCLKQFDKNKDKKLSSGELNAVKTIKIDRRGFKSLKGIEKFVNLEKLSAAENNFSKVDLSSNAKLKYADLRGQYLETVFLSRTQEIKKLIIGNAEQKYVD